MTNVTVGIPIYNAEKFLSAAINSVLQQTYTDFTLLLVNDGSTDTSLDIIKKYAEIDSRIVVVNDGVNKGLIARLNEMVQLANSKYFVRMDADDIMFPERLEKQLHLFEEFPETDLCSSSAISIDKNNQVLGIKIAKLPKSKQEVLKGVFPIHPTVMARTSFFKKHPYQTGFHQMEDMELWYRTVDTNTFAIIEKPLLFYREDSTKNSSKHKKMYNGLEKFVDTYLNDDTVLSKQILKNSKNKYLIYKILEFFNLEKFLFNRRFEVLPEKSHYEIKLQKAVGNSL